MTTKPIKYEFELGAELEDSITGFRGVATSRIAYINGCVQFGLMQKVKKDGSLLDPQFFDFQRLVQISAAKPMPSRDGGAERMREAPKGRGHG